MLRFGVLAAASVLALTACGDVVEFPGTSDIPGHQDGTDTPEPSVPDPATPPAGTDPEIPTDPVSEPEPGAADPDTVPVTEPDPTDPATNTENGETPTTGDDVDPADPANPVDPADPADPSTDSTEPQPAALEIESLLEVNAEICAASEEPTLTVAEVADAGEPEPNFGTAVVNGTEVDRSLFPGIVKLEPRRRIPNTTRTSSGHCAATRIADQWFVTAAHCLDSEYDTVTLVTGVTRLNDPAAVRVAAQTTICHSSYGGSAEEYANDIALVKIVPEVAETLTDVPIARYGATEKLLGATNYPTVDMAGWGLTGFSGNLSNELLTAQLKTNNVGPAIISIASQNGAGPCVGDSGGPLYVTEADSEKTLVGVLSVVENNLSTGKFCEGDYNGRYTNLQGFQTWIDAVIDVCDSAGGDALCVDG